MFNKNKLNFWWLVYVFGGLTVMILFQLWNSPQQPKAQMMNTSMGNMMKQMHVSNITIYDLLNKSETQSQMQIQMREMFSHHQDQSSNIYRLNYLTTSVIYLLLPLIIGGSIILAIVWLK